MEPGSSALLVDCQGQVTETAAANILVVQKGTIYSPPADCILEGISRKVVIELCAELGIAFVEKPLTVDDVHAADEVFLTSTPYCLAGVKSFQGRLVAWPGPTLRRLHDAWSGQVDLNIHAQIMA
jgi:branched-subunit amino acid aminotransferase/4-amino-4-deoxychorismate lyase